MKMQIDVPEEFTDQLVEHELINSYKMVSNELKRLKELKKPAPHQQEDIVDLTKYLESLMVVGNWFVWQFEKKVKKK
jgi:hypothetical protein